jgi:REP element-mobilizing transposase RayT
MQMLKNRKRKQVAHRKRKAFGGSALVVTTHLVDGLPSLRTEAALDVFKEALAIAKERFGCRILEYTLQSNHIHLTAEAPDQKALGQAMKGLLVRLARGFNKLWGRMGKVFESRFHSTVLSTMRQVHRGLRYVLNNARKHGVFVPHGQPDPFSSGPWFQHWRERLWQPFRTDPSPVARPRIAMMVELARKNLPVGLNDLPGSSIDLWR